jgi:deoxyadenosine/deoxycytidine kinase
VVGPCTAGKSTLTARLKEAGYEARHVAQEHSYVPDMWKRFTKPDVLIYLDVTWETAKQRRKIWWGPDVIEIETERLRHAREYCDLYISTDQLSADEVASQVLNFLAAWES